MTIQARTIPLSGRTAFDFFEQVILPTLPLSRLPIGNQPARNHTDQGDTPNLDMGKGALDEMVVRVIAYLARIRFARLPSRVEAEQRDGFRSGAMGMGPVMQPRPIFTVRVQVKGGSILGGGIGGANTSSLLTHLTIRVLKLAATPFELAEERARLRNGVGNCNLQFSNRSRGCEMTDYVNGIAFLKMYE